MHSLYTPLLTDLYQLTMAYGYWRLGMHEQEAVFHLLFRSNPFKGNYALCCGLETLVSFFQHWKFHQSDVDYLSSLKNAAKKPLFSQQFLKYLKQLSFTCDVDAIPEGTIVFPNEPILRIKGPILQCQLMESTILNIINFQTLIATKASRVCRAAKGEEVIEFGMRRAQGPDGAVSASRAAYIGGCSATSNTLAGKLFDIPVRGTQAHSWIMAFDDELTAFKLYAKVMPNNCILLVDTYHTLEGVRRAIKVGKALRKKGAELIGIRLDSGNMITLSKQARKLLDEAGLKKTIILASNSLDEYVISDLKQKGAKIKAWGVGTHLATAYDQPALDGVYKLSALQGVKGKWEYKLKLSEEKIKTSHPGTHQIRRFFCNEQYVIDVIYDIHLGMPEIPDVIVLSNKLQRKCLDDYDAFVDLLEPIFRRGKRIQKPTSIHLIREKALAAVEDFYHQHHETDYPVALEKKLYDLKQQLIKNLKK